MATLKGPYFFTGKLGNIKSVYNKRLKHYVLSTKGGPNKELLYRSPTFARARENMREFKGCGRWASQLRKSLLSLRHLFGEYYYGEMVRLAKSLQVLDRAHPRGERAIASGSCNPMFLINLCLNRRHPFENVLYSNPVVAFSSDRTTVVLTLGDFSPFSRLHWSSRFACYRFVLLIAQLPDLIYSQEGNDYLPSYPDLEQLTVCTRTPWLPWQVEENPVILKAAFEQPVPQASDRRVIVALGVEISPVAVSDGDATGPWEGSLKIVECFE